MRCNLHALRAGLPVLLAAAALFFGCTPDFDNPLDPENARDTAGTPAPSRWTAKAPMPTARSLPACAVSNGKIYVFGGQIDTGYVGYLTGVVEEYDPSANHWTSKATMPSWRCEAAAVEVAGAVYVIGGDGGYSTVEKYVPSIDSWPPETLAEDPVGRQGAAACAINGKIFVIGGLNGSCLNDVQEFDPAPPAAWTAVDTLSAARTGLAACVVNGKIYAIGGEDNAWNRVATVEEYDPATRAWTEKRPMPTRRRGIGAAVVNNRIYVFGGLDNTVLDKVEVYDPSADAWTSLPPMRTPRCAMACAAVNNRIYLIGGWNERFLATVEEYNPE